MLPFQNLSGDPEQEYFADGMVEEIIIALSRFRQLFVIARNSMRVSAATPGSRLGIACCTATAQRTASTTLANSTNRPSPVDDAAVMLRDSRIDELMAQRFEAFERAFLVRPHQPRVTCHIGGEDRGETAGLAHVSSLIAKRRPERKSSRCSGFRR